MRRLLALLYGILCYLIFLGTFLYAIWFVWTLDRPAEGPPLVRALVTDAALLALFALQHSGMARQSFKRRWTKLIPQPIERSTYVLAASAFLLAVMVFWQPIPTLLWDLQAPFARMLLHALFFAGWLLLLTCTFLIDHFELFGVKQVWKCWRGQPFEPPAFKTPGPYKFVRHPALSGVSDRFLERAADDARTLVFLRHVHGVHSSRHPARGARFGPLLRRGIPDVPPKGFYADPVAR